MQDARPNESQLSSSNSTRGLTPEKGQIAQSSHMQTETNCTNTAMSSACRVSTTKEHKNRVLDDGAAGQSCKIGQHCGGKPLLACN